MPHRRVLRLQSLVGPLSAALALVAVLALAPSASLSAYAQGGPDGPMMGPPGGMGMGMGPGGGMGMGPMFGPRGGGSAGYVPNPFGELAVEGQTQICRESVGADTNWRGFYGPTVGHYNPNFVGYAFPPYGGLWGFYTGAGNTCMWRPT